jgi:predicted TIM-barrel fold metal-dependent hydrolase
MTKFNVFDIHQHVGSLDIGGREAGSVVWKSDEDYAKRVQILDKFGVRAAAVMPSSQYLRPNGIPDTCAMNDLVADYRNRYRGRFPVAMGTVEPLYGEEAGVREIRRIAEKLRLDGIVWHHRYQGTFINDRRMHAFLQVMAEYHLPAFIHVFAESTMEAPWGVEALAEKHPHVTFIALDAFSGNTQTQYMIAIAKRCPNVLLETGVTFPLGRIIEEAVVNLGSERLLFGTDLYLAPLMYLYPDVMHQILEAPTLTDQDKQNIFWNNASKLFRLEG